MSFLSWKRKFFFTDTASVHTYMMKTINENGTFRKRCFHVYVWTDENVGFRIRWCNTSFTTTVTHALWGMLSYFHSLAFSYGQAKTIRIRFVWTRPFLKTEGKYLRFQTKTDTCGRGLSLLGNGNGKAMIYKFYHLCQNAGAVPSLQLQPKFPPVF